MKLEKLWSISSNNTYTVSIFGFILATSMLIFSNLDNVGRLLLEIYQIVNLGQYIYMSILSYVLARKAELNSKTGWVMQEIYLLPSWILFYGKLTLLLIVLVRFL